MFVKSLTISGENGIIREINFRKGINLIVDESITEVTGNDVGKTTTLKLIDFCLGGNSSGVYVDPSSKKNEYTLVKNFLIHQKVIINLTLKEDLDIENSKEIEIERNFLSRKEIIRRINSKALTEEEFDTQLLHLLFPHHKAQKPTFRQIISHNLRYEDESILQTLRNLNHYTSDAEYETLHLFLLGCEVGTGNRKQELLTKIHQENQFKKRLEKNQSKTQYEAALSVIEADIHKLNRKKTNLNLNENFESDLEQLNDLKYQITRVSSDISKVKIRREIILEAKSELEADKSRIDTKQLQIIYSQAISQINGIQKTFEDLVNYHNQMIVEKIKFITQELPSLERELETKNIKLRDLLSEEKKLTQVIAKTDSFEDLEKLIAELNEKYRRKGEYENVIQQLAEIEIDLNTLNKQLESIDEQLFSDDFEQIVKNQRDKFNSYFASISNELYGEQYALNYEIITNKKNQKLYKFSTFNVNTPNISSGKRQGEISCFDIAYILFADDENIPCLHFVLNDKKELMDGRQLVKISDLVNRSNMQFVTSILRDKLPDELNRDEYIILKLSQNDKLFRIE